MTEHKPYPANVPGDFYVEDGCCTMCEAPFAEAPDLFGVAKDPAGYSHCYIKRQPASVLELEQMLCAFRVAETECIRYRGSDRTTQLRLVEDGEGPQCDKLPADLQKRSEEVCLAQRLLLQEKDRQQRPEWWQLLWRWIRGRA